MRRNKKKKNIWLSGKVLMPAFIIAIMVLSGLGYMSNNASSTVEYGEYKFKIAGNFYITKIDGKSLRFSFLPDQVEDIEISEEAKNLLNGASTLYITYDPEDRYVGSIAQVEFFLANNMFDYVQVHPALAFTVPNEYGRPVIECSSELDFPALNFRTGNETKIFSENRCIVLQGSSINAFALLQDTLLYNLAGIIE